MSNTKPPLDYADELPIPEPNHLDRLTMWLLQWQHLILPILALALVASFLI
jgi:hypothetical protein